MRANNFQIFLIGTVSIGLVGIILGSSLSVPNLDMSVAIAQESTPEVKDSSTSATDLKSSPQTNPTPIAIPQTSPPTEPTKSPTTPPANITPTVSPTPQITKPPSSVPQPNPTPISPQPIPETTKTPATPAPVAPKPATLPKPTTPEIQPKSPAVQPKPSTPTSPPKPTLTKPVEPKQPAATPSTKPPVKTVPAIPPSSTKIDKQLIGTWEVKQSSGKILTFTFFEGGKLIISDTLPIFEIGYEINSSSLPMLIKLIFKNRQDTGIFKIIDDGKTLSLKLDKAKTPILFQKKLAPVATPVDPIKKDVPVVVDPKVIPQPDPASSTPPVQTKKDIPTVADPNLKPASEQIPSTPAIAPTEEVKSSQN